MVGFDVVTGGLVVVIGVVVVVMGLVVVIIRCVIVVADGVFDEEDESLYAIPNIIENATIMVATMKMIAAGSDFLLLLITCGVGDVYL